MTAKLKRLPRARKAKAELDAPTRAYLLTGHYFGRHYRYDEMPTEPFRTLWLEHRDDLLTFWLGDPDAYNSQGGYDICPGGPGTRPWAWWQWAAPPAPLKMRKALFGLEFSEPDYAYLRRHRLFTAAEFAYFARFPKITPRDWARLQSEDWHSRKGRELWLRQHINLTPKGERWRKGILDYWHRLGLEQTEELGYD
jgi:hypothetical protein